MSPRRLYVVVGRVMVATVTAGCGGKVIFDAGAGTGTGGAVATHPSTSKATSSSSATGQACLTTVTIGTGDFGPHMVKGTKCFPATPGQACPLPSAAAPQIPVDDCHALASVDDKCAPPQAGECCYDITETLTCKAN